MGLRIVGLASWGPYSTRILLFFGWSVLGAPSTTWEMIGPQERAISEASAVGSPLPLGYANHPSNTPPLVLGSRFVNTRLLRHRGRNVGSDSHMLPSGSAASTSSGKSSSGMSSLR